MLIIGELRVVYEIIKLDKQLNYCQHIYYCSIGENAILGPSVLTSQLLVTQYSGMNMTWVNYKELGPHLKGMENNLKAI